MAIHTRHDVLNFPDRLASALGMQDAQYEYGRRLWQPSRSSRAVLMTQASCLRWSLVPSPTPHESCRKNSRSIDHEHTK